MTGSLRQARAQARMKCQYALQWTLPTCASHDAQSQWYQSIVESALELRGLTTYCAVKVL